MGESSGTESAPISRARSLWLTAVRGLKSLGVIAWRNRTKVTGYIGILGSTIQVGILGGQHLPMLLLSTAVALIGHYNDRHQGDL